MSSYEELYTELLPLEKDLKDAAAQVTKLQKSVQKDTESGNLTGVRKSLVLFSEAIDKLQKAYDAVCMKEKEFDEKDYFISGDFTKQLLEECQKREIDVTGDLGVYEMFPFKVRISCDEEHDAEVTVNRKKIQSIRPSFVADTIKAGQEKLYKARFDQNAFMNEIAEAYEVTCLKSKARMGSTQRLDKVYKAMVPMARARKEYDKQAFAFDLARIYEAGPDAWVTKDGIKYYFGSSRDGKTGYRVLSSSGVESYVYTIKLVKEDEES